VAQRLVDVIAEHSGDALTIKQLVDLVYADDPNGGPLSAQRSLNVIAHHANKQLATQGYQIRATHRGAGARYELVPLEKRIRGVAA
jgi:DNA-binding response OmpR family regulator